MKIITYSKIGYNSPSQSNWSYGIWKIDCIDTKSRYCMSYTVKENFGGDSRLRRRVSEELKHEMIETKGVFPTQSVKGIKDIDNMEDDKMFTIIKEFITEN